MLANISIRQGWDPEPVEWHTGDKRRPGGSIRVDSRYSRAVFRLVPLQRTPEELLQAFVVAATELQLGPVPRHHRIVPGKGRAVIPHLDLDRSGDAFVGGFAASLVQFSGAGWPRRTTAPRRG